MFIKIIDIMLKSEEDRERFFQMFSGLCDTIFVEHLVIMEQQMGGPRRQGGSQPESEWGVRGKAYRMRRDVLFPPGQY